MGNFRIVIEAVGSHGQDRGKKDGEEVDFTEVGYGSPKNENTPEAIAQRAVEELTAHGTNVERAWVHHWPGTGTDVIDNLLTNKRKGNF